MPYIHPIILPQLRALKDDLFQMSEFLWVPKNGHPQDIEWTSLPPLHSKTTCQGNLVLRIWRRLLLSGYFFIDLVVVCHSLYNRNSAHYIPSLKDRLQGFLTLHHFLFVLQTGGVHQVSINPQIMRAKGKKSWGHGSIYSCSLALLNSYPGITNIRSWAIDTKARPSFSCGKVDGS